MQGIQRGVWRWLHQGFGRALGHAFHNQCGSLLTLVSLSLVETPEGFVVFYGHGDKLFPVDVSDQIEPEDVGLFGQEHVIGLNDMDQGKLAGGRGRDGQRGLLSLSAKGCGRRWEAMGGDAALDVDVFLLYNNSRNTSRGFLCRQTNPLLRGQKISDAWQRYGRDWGALTWCVRGPCNAGGWSAARPSADVKRIRRRVMALTSIGDDAWRDGWCRSY
jgi:hypothetical protein